MLQLRSKKSLLLLCVFAWLFAPMAGYSSQQRGQVTFNGSPVPGAMIIATREGKKFVTVSDTQGRYFFANLIDGTWKIQIEMPCFATIQQEITVAPNSPGIAWPLKLLPLNQIMAQTKVTRVGPKAAIANAPRTSLGNPNPPKSNQVAEPPKSSAASTQADDGFLLNGSVNNAATSQFSLAQAFGNARKGGASLYNGGLGLVFDNSALDARPYSLSGLDTPKSSYNTMTAIVTLAGPLNIPHLMPHGPNFFVVYQRTRNRIATTQTGLVPTNAQRNTVDPVAAALLALYPLPNIIGNTNYNYQIPLLNNSHQDVLQTKLDKTINPKNQVYGGFAIQSTRADNKNLFAFRDATDTLGINSNVSWQHRLKRGLYANVSYRFSRLRTQVTPYFQNRVNISGDAGLIGNNQSPENWGPPTLVFASGITTLSDAQSSFDRNRTDALSASVQWYRGRHNITFGGDFRRQEFNYFSQQDPRGTFTFTGAAYGSDFADFQHGVPDTASIAYGNADKYLRQSVSDAYFSDDWRVRPDLTISAGVRWEYGSPITELKNRLVNLDIASGFTAVAPVLASSPTGSLTGERYPTSLLRPDRNNIEPRVGTSWRPFPASSMIIRAGYGVYADTSIYQATALQLAQQAPLSISINANNTACTQTLRTGPTTCTSTTANTFAVDPDFRVGYAQVWQLAVQRDLPAALQLTATYLGIKGTRGVQEFLPNTYPLGATNPCPLCPVGFVYRTSNGNSTREAGSIHLRRRLRSGFTASLQYTYSKSIDDDSTLGGQGPLAAGKETPTLPKPTIAQNWLDLTAERALSTFDQRHLLNATFQYTTGMGLGGRTLLGGWRGRLYKEWTLVGQIAVGSGLPETPVYLAAVNSTGFTGSIRPNRTSASLYTSSSGRFLNPAAYTAPQPGQWGEAGRNSIIGPGQFTFNSSLSRTFRLDKRLNLDIRIDATNLLNHVVYSAYYTTINPSLTNPLFGLPIAANPMRSLQTTMRLRF